MSDNPIVYFRRDSLVFLVSHPGASIGDLKQADILALANQKAKHLFADDVDRFDVKAEIPTCTFAAEGSKALESADKPAAAQSDMLQDLSEFADRLVHGDLRGAWQFILDELHPSARVRAEVVAPSSFSILFPVVKESKMADLVLLAKALDDALADFNKLESMQSKFVLQEVALHWHNSAGNDGLGSGGPGGPPTLQNGAMSDSHPFKLPVSLDSVLEGAGKFDVKVAILDTAPSDAALDQAHHDMGKPPHPHPLVTGMLDAPRKLIVENRDPLDRLDKVYIEGHNYDMPDHGSFVAGIIHTIAPYAELHLWRVLNDRGVGDTQSIATGLAAVFKRIYADSQKQGPKWVINASLMMTAPSDDAHLQSMLDTLAKPSSQLSAADQQEQKDLLGVLTGGSSVPKKDIHDWLLNRQTDAVEYMCYMLNAYAQTPVIAAAGNDRRGLSSPQPGARYPARADSAVGVGALQDKTHPASYSNTADQPASVGIVTFGGDPSTTQVLGLYIGKDPAGTQSASGWAQWSGTSFATPIVSGIATALVSTGAYATTKDAIDDLFNKTRLSGSIDSDGLAVTQS